MADNVWQEIEAIKARLDELERVEGKLTEGFSELAGYVWRTLWRAPHNYAYERGSVLRVPRRPWRLSTIILHAGEEKK